MCLNDGRPSSSTMSKIFSSETAWLNKKHPMEEGNKFYINGHGHMTKMAAMVIWLNSKNL